MALSDFNNDYLDRTAGLRNFVAPPPPFIDSNGQPVSSPGSGSAMSALATLLPPQDVTAPAPATAAPSGMQSFAEKDPTGKAMDIANEAYQPGYIAKNDQAASESETPFRHTALGALAAGLIPGLAETFQQQQAQSMAKYWDSVKDEDPVTQLTGAMKVDPNNAQKYVGAISQFVTGNLSPIAKTQAEEAEMNLNMERFKNNALMTGMKQAQEFANGGAPAAPPVAPQDRAAVLGPPAEFSNQQKQPSALQSIDKYPAQTQAESGGDPNAVSLKGALGAKQIMPATGADPGFGVRPWDGTKADNIRFGNDYYDAMLKKYNGNVPVALAAYNMGPGKTDQWLQSGADPEKLPQETMSYVTKLAPQMQAAQGGQPAAAQPATPQQQHQQLVAKQVGMGLLPYSDLAKAIDPLNPENIPKQTMEGDTLFSAKPGEAPKPYAVPPMNSSEFKTGPGGVILPSKSFGFVTQPHTTATLKIAQDQDKAMQAQDQNNDKVVKGMQDQVDILKKALPNLLSGPGMENINSVYAGADPLFPHVSPNSKLSGILPTKGGNWDKQAQAYSQAQMAGNALALSATKLDSSNGGGGKAGKINLLTTLASKPSVTKDAAANQSSLNELEAGIADHETSRDLDQEYREKSPYGITDENTRTLDDALKTIYPLKTVDAAGIVKFNQHNADMIRHQIPDAIARPDGYIKQAQAISGGKVSYNPTAAADSKTAFTTPSGIQYTVVGQ